MIQLLGHGTWIEPRHPGFARGKNTRRGAATRTERSKTVLNDTEVKRIVEAINEYRELVQQSTDMRDQLESLQKRWSSLRQERDQLRTSVDGLHQTLAQLKVDYQSVMKRLTDLSATEDTVLDNVKFLIDELTSVLKKHEG
jgi:chromosome segregation ATPase